MSIRDMITSPTPPPDPTIDQLLCSPNFQEKRQRLNGTAAPEIACVSGARQHEMPGDEPADPCLSLPPRSRNRTACNAAFGQAMEVSWVFERCLIIEKAYRYLISDTTHTYVRNADHRLVAGVGGLKKRQPNHVSYHNTR